MWRKGTATWCSVGDMDLGEMGPGVRFHFVLLRYLTVALLLMAAASIPVIALAMGGRGVSTEDVDAFKVALTTVANIGDAFDSGTLDCETTSVAPGVDPDNPAGGNYTVCRQHAPTLTGWAGTMSYNDASALVAACDFVAAVIFLLVVILLRGRVSDIAEDTHGDYLVTSKYAVFVQGLPKGVTEAELLDHFNRLYQLSAPDVRRWHPLVRCCRAPQVRAPPQPPLRPVRDCANTHDEGYLGGWVAELTVVRVDGESLRRFISLAALTTRLRSARARVKMYRRDTPLIVTGLGESGHDPHKMAAALRSARQVEAQIEYVRAMVAIDRVESKMASKQAGAYVIFNHSASRARCLADYAPLQHWVGRVLQPYDLRLRGKRLRVSEAAEPSNLRWEHADTTAFDKFLRRAVTFVAIVLMVSVSFIVVLLAQRQRADFTASMPRLSDCKTHVVASVYGTYDLSGTPEGAVPDLVRDRTPGVCPLGQFQVWWAGPTGAGLLAASENATWAGGDVQARCASPCVPVEATGRCPMLSCSESDWPQFGVRCDSAGYLDNTRVGCYCSQVLRSMLSEYGLFEGTRRLADTESDMCAPYLSAFALANGYSLAAVLVVVVVNGLLRWAIKGLSSFERHKSLSSESQSTGVKQFVAQFVNTSVLLTLLSADLPASFTFQLPGGNAVGDGPFTDFDRRWYALVAPSIAVSVLGAHLSFLAGSVAQVLCIDRCRITCKAKYQVTQRAMDKLYAAGQLDLASGSAQLLSTVFSCMAFSTGVPAMLFVALIAVAAHLFVDRYFVLHYWARPPAFDLALSRTITNLLPWALVMHLAVGAWQMSNGDVFKSDALGVTSANGVSGSDALGGVVSAETVESILNATSTVDVFGVQPRLTRLNTIPAVLLLCCVLLYLTAGRIIAALLGRLIRVASCGRFCNSRGSSKVGTASQADATQFPFTEEYRAMVKHDTTLSHYERQHGFVLAPMAGQASSNGYKAKWAEWLPGAKDMLGQPHVPGTVKFTWEVITDHSLHTYNMLVNPSYKLLKDVFLQVSARARAAIAEPFPDDGGENDAQEAVNDVLFGGSTKGIRASAKGLSSGGAGARAVPPITTPAWTGGPAPEAAKTGAGGRAQPTAGKGAAGAAATVDILSVDDLRASEPATAPTTSLAQAVSGTDMDSKAGVSDSKRVVTTRTLGGSKRHPQRGKSMRVESVESMRSEAAAVPVQPKHGSSAAVESSGSPREAPVVAVSRNRGASVGPS